MVPWRASAGSLASLHASADFGVALEADPAAGEGFWFLVHGVNCAGDGSYGSAAADDGIDTSPFACLSAR